jgi:tetratricopeptide (TPR) repeat protein
VGRSGERRSTGGAPHRHRDARLELANAHLGDKWSDARVLVEWACELLREDKPTEAERLWHLASIDLAHGARDWTLLRKRLPEVSWEGAIVPPDGPKAYDHLEHAIARFPADAEVRFAGALTEAVQVAPAWRRTRPSRPLVSVRGGPDRDPAITALREFLADPHHGAEAHLWVGMLLMLDHQRPNDALGYFEVASRSHDAFVAYLAHYQAGRLLEQTGLASASEGHYRRALTVLPNTQSAALSLAALQFGRGNPEEAYRLASASVSDPAAVDPFQSYGFGSYRSFRHNLGRIREALTW